MRSTCGIGLLTALSVMAAAARPTAQAIDPFDRFQTWLQAVNAERPGDPDEAVRAIGHWSIADIELVLPLVLAYPDTARRQEVKPSSEDCPGCSSSSRERQRLLTETRRRVWDSFRASLQEQR